MASDSLSRHDLNDPIKMDSEESPIGSSVDGDSGEPCDGEGGQTDPTPEQAPKRKGGRKPIYATTEERKQRNRQAQAAFRERRTEYIKQLEHTISVHEHNLSSLTSAHRQTTDECLMLRYKNSLLERILLEKGIDVQTELHAKHGSPNFGPTHPIAPIIQPPPISRTLLNRSRRSASSIAPKVETGYGLPPIQATHLPAASPKSRATAASPTTTEGYGPSPASSTDHAPGIMRSGMQPSAMKQPGHPIGHMSNPRMMSSMQQHQGQGLGGRMGGGGNVPFYQTPQYQSHQSQLGKQVVPVQRQNETSPHFNLAFADQEYDAAAEMMDEQQHQQQQAQADSDASGPGPYPGAVYATHAAQQQQQMSPTSTTAADAARQQQQQGLSIGAMLDPMNGTLGFSFQDDPFGLSESMAFPTPFAYDTSNMR